MGELLIEQKQTVGLNRGMSGTVVSGSVVEPVRDTRPTLADIGVDKKLSSHAQKVAAIPEALQRAGRHAPDVVDVDVARLPQFGFCPPCAGSAPAQRLSCRAVCCRAVLAQVCQKRAGISAQASLRRWGYLIGGEFREGGRFRAALIFTKVPASFICSDVLR